MGEKRFGKKQLVLAVMVLVLGAAVYLNYYVAANVPTTTGVNDSSTSATTPTTQDVLGESQFVNNTTATTPTDYFASARQNRQDARNRALDIIKDTLQDAGIDAASQQEVIAAAATVASAVEQEDAIESLIKAKGFEDCVVYIEEDQCYVAVKAAELAEAQTLQILQIVTSQSPIDADNVSIVAVE